MNFLFWLTVFVSFQTCIPDADASSTQFRPKVISICTEDGFNVTLETLEPFFGTIHPVDRTECRVFGSGKNETKYQIPFSRGNACGLQYNPMTNTYSVKIEVNNGHNLSLETDRTFDLSCKGQQNRQWSTFAPPQSNNSINDIGKSSEHESNIGFYDGDRRVTEVIYGNPYLIQLTSSRTNLTGEHYRITDCTVSDRINTSIKLVDAIGCLTSCGLITEFKYSNGIAEAVVPSMFKFPESLGLEITCSIAYISSGFPHCPLHCENDHSELLDDAVYKGNDTDLFDEVLSIRRINRSLPNQIDTVNCSVEVITANRLLATSTNNVNVAEVSCTPNTDIATLRNYCIVLCTAFLIGCIINLCCCCQCLLRRRNTKCTCRAEGGAKSKKKTDDPHLSCDFWIKEKTMSADLVDDYESGDWNRTLPRPLSAKSYATVRQKLAHPHANLCQLPLRFPQGITESPSLKSTDSSLTSTFGIRPIIPTSYTVDTDLNSLHSSVSTERNAGYFLKSGELSVPPFNLQNRCLTNITNNNNSKEAYSIL